MIVAAKNPRLLACPRCGGAARLHVDCPRPVAYCRANCSDDTRQYRETPREAAHAWNSYVREIRWLLS